MGWEDGAWENKMSVGPDVIEVQTPTVDCTLSCKQQRVGRGFYNTRVTGSILLFWKANLRWAFSHCTRWETNQVGELTLLGLVSCCVSGKWWGLAQRLQQLRGEKASIAHQQHLNESVFLLMCWLMYILRMRDFEDIYFLKNCCVLHFTIFMGNGTLF